MKKCPTHNVEIHVYTTFEFCPKCEDEKMAYAKSAKKAMEADIVLDFKPAGGILPGKLTVTKASPQNGHVSQGMQYAFTVVMPNGWQTGKQMAPLFQDYSSAKMHQKYFGGDVEEVQFVKQHVDWDDGAGISRHLWLIFQRGGSTNLGASPKKAEIL